MRDSFFNRPNCHFCPVCSFNNLHHLLPSEEMNLTIQQLGCFTTLLFIENQVSNVLRHSQLNQKSSWLSLVMDEPPQLSLQVFLYYIYIKVERPMVTAAARSKVKWWPRFSGCSWCPSISKLVRKGRCISSIVSWKMAEVCFFLWPQPWASWDFTVTVAVGHHSSLA